MFAKSNLLGVQGSLLVLQLFLLVLLFALCGKRLGLFLDLGNLFLGLESMGCYFSNDGWVIVNRCCVVLNAVFNHHRRKYTFRPRWFVSVHWDLDS